MREILLSFSTVTRHASVAELALAFVLYGAFVRAAPAIKGEWTTAGGGLSLVPPSANSQGSVLWLPKLTVVPNLAPGKALETVLASWERSPAEYRAQSERYLADRAGDDAVSTAGRLGWLEATAKLPVDLDAPDAAERIRVQSDLIVFHQRAFYGVEFTNAWLSVGRLSRRLAEENRTMQRDILTRNLWAVRGRAASQLAHSAVFFYCLWGGVSNLPAPVREAYIGEVVSLGILGEPELREIHARFRARDSAFLEERSRDGGGRRRH